MKTLKLLILASFLTAALSSANSNASIVENTGLKLVGEGKMSFLFWDVYLARLYTPSGDYKNTLSPMALEFNYLMDIEAKDLIEETVNQWRKQKMQQHEDEKLWTEQLFAIWPDVAEGDQLLFVVDENHHSRFYHNQNLVGTIESKDFSKRFSAIWLSEKTTAPKVRKKLLGD